MIKKLIRKLVFPNTYSSEAYINHLKAIGCKIGKGTIIWSPNNTYIDETRPFLIEIGDYCKISRGVTILAHDYSRSVVRKAFGENIGEAGKTVIGDNCFLGNQCILLMGVKIGNNCIIAAGSVVTKDFPNNVVIGGNPARDICTIEEYYEKRYAATVDEAKMYAKVIYERTGRKPTLNEMGKAFAWLYLPRENRIIEKNMHLFELSGDDSDDVIQCFKNTSPVFESFDAFLAECGIE